MPCMEQSFSIPISQTVFLIDGTETILHIGRREPFERVADDKLVVASFAW